MSPIEQAIYTSIAAFAVPALVAVIIKAICNGLNAVIDKGASRDWPDGFNGDERGFNG
jgi:hypothetical protein